MKFEEVMPALKNGKKIKRKEWFEDNGYRTAEKALAKIRCLNALVLKEVKGFPNYLVDNLGNVYNRLTRF